MSKLSVEKLKKKCDLSQFNFIDTSEIKPIEGIIGQSRAEKAMNFGLRIKGKGYNIYVAGIPGTGKTSYAKSIVKKIAEKEKTPDDWVYVHNFSDPDYPKAIRLEPGQGIEFSKDMETLIENIKSEIQTKFSGEEFENKKREILQEYQTKSTAMLNELDKSVREKGFTIQKTASGVYLIPLVDGEALDQEKLHELPEEKTQEIQEKLPEAQKEFNKVLRKIKELEKSTLESSSNLEEILALDIVKSNIDALKSKYSDKKEIGIYLDAVQKDILLNISDFKEKSEENNPLKSFLPSGKDDNTFKKYSVNVFIDNGNLNGAPVVVEPNPTYYNLFGKIEGRPQFGTISTDYTDIKPGAIHKANGGFLIIQAEDLLKNAFSWDTLKRTLKNNKIYIENISEHYSLFPMSTLKPEPISCDIKVILIGSPTIYQLLYYYDMDFRKLFKVKVDFDIEMTRNKENILRYISFIASVCKNENFPPFDKSAVEKVVEYGSRLAGHQEKLSTRFNKIVELIYEASAWAEFEESPVVSKKHISKAISEKVFRDNLLEEKIQESISYGDILIDIEGKVVGQINALSVYKLGDYSFGRPSRITAQTFIGKTGVVNIEREAKMSGKIHDKGVLILSGFLGGKYAKDKPLTLTASLTFEQSYGSIDGDSASLAELVALLSSISGIPIKQEIAVTGSLNQKGEVQPIGGVNEKIEGFFAVCKNKGLTGKQGVIIPEQNIKNLMLKDEILTAVEEGKFTIYAVKNIDEALTILMDTPAGKVHEMVNNNLKTLAKKSKETSNKENS